MAPTKPLLTAATGYIGGTVLTQLLQLLNSTVSEIKELFISVLIRKKDQAELYISKGVPQLSLMLVESRVFSDKEDIYSYLKHREALEPYAQRATDIKTVDVGTGFFNQKLLHIPVLIQGAVAAGQAEYVGEGSGAWDYVHVVDLAEFFELLVAKDLKRRNSWMVDIANTTLLILQEAAEKYTGENEQLAEVGLLSNSLTTAELARELGWIPKKEEIDFQQSLLDDFNLLFGQA
ncbi:hypothetical protein BDV29DRAFT_162236 [Aspergillus leporis]|uniref:NAD-dependent epimerase/dehydratase domain-containing protein n=1 Tax=Aspergillus leporis TaxID=41062 RepID=A0A5N5WJF7_9EURO|nr:hypothetical protein BDV29DRAFT_162236 [Aspergillus leporis]